ncbi:MAG: hypothetical protein OXG92_08330 [Chloroflexi bacterium]|nr:hypothetical protein [Chloroflexota bacterium]MCY3583290.1 hypothetical protein [Chloroflexota bacterium]MCY3716456.1 hypothetical protein [Chloroflexota bacterium]MDE2651718.1 hypothetical protein [Chloroflexota bacterium]MXX51357.1 hypothetical protein [Chloroflexota bacterium]
MRNILLVFLLFAAMGSATLAQSDALNLVWSPVYNTVRGIVDLRGTANIADQQWYLFEAAPYEADQDAMWMPVVSPSFAPAIDAELGKWNTSILADGFYQLRLHAVDSAQTSHFYTLGPILVNNNHSNLVNLEPVEPILPALEPQAAPEIVNRLPLPVGGHVLRFGESTIEAMHSAGMTWVKWQIPFIPGEDLTVARHRIKVTHEAGFRILLSVTGHVHDLSEGGDEYLLAYADFLGEVAALGADAIEVWNEMNLDREWTQGEIHPRNYAKMLRPAYAAIKAANPDTFVITGALSPTGAEGVFGPAKVWNDDNYYRGMANEGIADYADCIGVHYNEGVLPPSQLGGDPRDHDYPTRYFISQLDRAGYYFQNYNIPLCITELGYLSPEGYGPLPGGFTWAANTSVVEQAAWLAQAIEIAADYTRSPVDLLIVWNMDFEQYEPDPQAGYAIIRRDGNCPACQTIGALIR